MALELFNKCPRCGKPIITQTTAKNTVIQKCAKKVDGGCGFFANLGHVPKEGTGEAKKLEAKIEDSQAATGEGTGARRNERTGAKSTGTGKTGHPAKPEKRFQPEGGKLELEPKPEPKKRGWFSRGLDW